MNSNKAQILIIEDETTIQTFISTILSSSGYRVLSVSDASEALAILSTHVPDAILLDLGLPDMDGMDLLRKIREKLTTPVIIISARSFEKDKVEALDNGADDYITKPFGSAELLARIRTALRHSNRIMTKDTGSMNILKNGDLTIDFENRQILVSGKEIHLTQIEYKLLCLLAKYIGKVLTYDFIISNIWNISSDKNSQQLLRVNMANIRRKIEENPGKPKYVLTEVGVGYRLADIEQ